MATYLELFPYLRDNTQLRMRTEVAIGVSVEVIRSGADDGTGDGTGFVDGASEHALRKTWAKGVMTNGIDAGLITRVLTLVLAANKAADIPTIEAATDATLQSNVNSAVDLLAGN